MPDTNGRLIRCFSLVFPDLDHEQIRAARRDSLPWDSLTAVTLLAVLQQEFGLEIDFTDFSETKLFESVENYIRSRTTSDDVGQNSLATLRESV
jgi:acyl carrier protein